MPSLLDMPTTAPAEEAWLVLWRLGIDLPHPSTGQTAQDWLGSLDMQPRLIHKIHRTALEGKSK